MSLKAGLYIVATPIGNLDDITIRALNILKNSTIILCEDTRISTKLLAKHNISAKLQIYNDHSDETKRQLICNLIDQGHVISLISDAGTPLISDPGYKLVRSLKQQGYFVDTAPGACSVIAGLTLSGLPTDQFLFCGFLPKTTEGKRKIFLELSKLKATLIFFESANRLNDSMSLALEVLGNRECCVARELTKLYQEAKLAPLSELINYYEIHNAKGEIILMISGYDPAADEQLTIPNLEQEIMFHLSQNISAKSAAALAHKKFSGKYSKTEIYKLTQKLSANTEHFVNSYKN